jgi:hypothetical protein
MNAYTFNLTADADTCPITGAALPAKSETLTIEAADLESARRLVPVHMTMRLRGQLLHVYHNGVELFGNF